jgi:hypothetical protein
MKCIYAQTCLYDSSEFVLPEDRQSFTCIRISFCKLLHKSDFMYVRYYELHILQYLCMCILHQVSNMLNCCVSFHMLLTLLLEVFTCREICRSHVLYNLGSICTPHGS